MNILITGATSGIGQGLALSYVKEGHKVIAIGRNSSALSQLELHGIYTIQLDLVDLSAVRLAFVGLAKDFPVLDIAILNAGNCEYVDVHNFDAEMIKRVMDANVISLANSIELVLPLLRKSSIKHLVGVASMAAYLPLSRAEAYGASKAAANYMLEAFAIDLKADGISVSVVNPGFVKTPLTAKNDFPMPFALDLDDAVSIIRKGIENKKIEIHFPYRLTIFIKIFSLLPRALWRKLGQRFKK
jgi:short-subunit dehydrogenase